MEQTNKHRIHSTEKCYFHSKASPTHKQINELIRRLKMSQREKKFYQIGRRCHGINKFTSAIIKIYRYNDVGKIDSNSNFNCNFC